MEVTIEGGYVRTTFQIESELRIITLSSSVLHAWQMLEKEKAILKLNGTKPYSIICVNKEIENKGSTIFLLVFRRCAHTKKEAVWVQSLETSPRNYLNLPLKIAT